MDRAIDSFLETWVTQIQRKPLLLRGARQTGKTFSVERIGAQFDEFVTVNFEKKPFYGGLFDLDLDPKRIIREIAASEGKVITPGKALLFFDEIQDCPKAITALRYFYEDLPELHVIGAGSLLDFELEKMSVPVGRIQFVHMRPMTFSEFVTASGNVPLAEAMGKFSMDRPPAPLIHQKCTQLLRQFLLVGGMPGVLNAFFASNSYLRAMEEQESILATYRADLNKYARRQQMDLVVRTFDGLAASIGRKVVYSAIAPDARAAQVHRAIDLLEKARVVTKIASSPASGLPLSSGSSDRHFKALFLDVGLLQSLRGVRAKEWFAGEMMADGHMGAVAEQFVGQELLAMQGPLSDHGLYYWHRQVAGSQAEVDYVSAVNGRILPIEVKSGKAGRLKSLRLFLDEHPDVSYGVKTSLDGLALEGSVVSIPLYLVSGIPALTGSIGRANRTGGE